MGRTDVASSKPTDETRVSRHFTAAVKLSDEPSYRIAQRAGIGPSTLSRIVNGIERVERGDSRVVAVAAVLGLPPTRAFARSKGRA
jgi:transcriptional regulator with XRE-family HTH domain